MIPFNFDYHRPGSLGEAVEAYARADRDGRKPSYLAGATEITTFCRMGRMKPGALVDIKRIPECRARGEEGNELVFGAALTLNEVIEGGSLPTATAGKHDRGPYGAQSPDPGAEHRRDAAVSGDCASASVGRCDRPACRPRG